MNIPSLVSTLTPWTVTLGLTLIATGAEAFPAYQPNPRGIPTQRVSGGTRSPGGASCVSNSGTPRLASLFPEDDLGYTTERYPAFQWYVPNNSASHVEFHLYEVIDEEDGLFQPVYQTAFVPGPEAGIATLQLPSSTGLPPLGLDTYYYWSVEMYCPQETTAVMMAEGFVELVIPDPELAAVLVSSDGLDRAAIAAENGLWFDATRALTEQLQTQPNDRETLESWQVLLESIGLENIHNVPLLP